jgi:hypothetical protein
MKTYTSKEKKSVHNKTLIWNMNAQNKCESDDADANDDDDDMVLGD